jgi:glycosyltransferase involved in cell wall biosynthesis
MIEHVVIVTPTLSFGGAEKVAVNLANAYISLGYKTTILIIKSNSELASQCDSRVELVYLNNERTLFSVFKLISTLKRIDCTTVISVLLEANILCGIAKIFGSKSRMIFRQANTLDDVLAKNIVMRNLYIALMKLTYFYADFVVANSNDTARDLILRNICVQSKIRVIDNPVLDHNTELMASQKTDFHWFNDPSLKVILNVGRLTEQKNQLMLIAIFAELFKLDANYRLVIIGDGHLRDMLRKEIDVKGLSEVAIILKPVPNPFPAFRAASLFVLTSDYEGFGNVVVESLSVGTNVIARNVSGGVANILMNGEYGYLFRSDNPLGKALEIDEIIRTNGIESKKLIERARSYSSVAIAKKYLNIVSDGQ